MRGELKKLLIVSDRCTKIGNGTLYVNIVNFWYYENLVSGAVYKIN